MTTTAPSRPLTTPQAAIPAAYTELCGLRWQASTVGSIGSLLSWDQETYMPHAAAAHRADQSSMMARLAHESATSPRIGELLGSCEGELAKLNGQVDPVVHADLREMRRDYDLATRLPADLVAELARTGSQAQEVWKDARQKSDFAMFRPWLEKMLDLSRRKARCLGYPAGGELYDALLDKYEPGATANMIESAFTPLRARLSALVKDLSASGRRIDTRVTKVTIDARLQHELGQFVLRAMGFDFAAGRLDTTTHPFCSGMAPGDTRLTTRYRDEAFTDALYGSMHEAGHGLYEQGLPKLASIASAPAYGRPLAESISLGIHESQSRMWENFVGRSREFWDWLWPIAMKMTSTSSAASPLSAYSTDDIFRAVNTATPSFIRVEADEATYNLHVMLRFELERAMLAGEVAVKDLPGEWNRRVKEYLGLDVPDDRRGCLQDVHWAFGLIGYFPTYTLGNLYAAQFWETINTQIPDLKQRMAGGDFAALKKWLNENIHIHGRRYRAAELCENLTGKPLSADPLMRHLEGKLRPLYR
ncbi:MAG: carboxypeptidase M32 [Phycisphaerales bacterium]|nr:carboxypeptidase M32 [Phycisphaerales bacterium]